MKNAETNLKLSLLQKFILIQTSRHGLMTTKALGKMSSGRWAYRTICSQVRHLRKKRALEKAKADEVILSAFELPKEFDIIGVGLGPVSHSKIHRRARSHALELAVLFSTWARRSNVVEVHSELEFERGYFANLGLDRIPDGLMLVKDSNSDQLILVELEYSFKSQEQIKDVLATYEKCFTTHAVFDRVVFVVHDPSTLAWYQRLIAEWPESIQRRVHLVGANSTNFDFENVLGEIRSDSIPVLMNFDNRCRHIAQEKWSKYAFSFLCKKQNSNIGPQSDGTDVSKG